MIYDDPNHPQYGPVRRLHLILMHLFGADLSVVEKEFTLGIGKDWSAVAASSLAMGVSEAQVARSTVSTMLGCYWPIQCRRTNEAISHFKA